MENEVRIKMGEIEFEAKGDAELIARERTEFFENILPKAMEAVAYTKSVQQQSIGKGKQEAQLLIQADEVISQPQENNFERKSISNFLQDKGAETDTDKILCMAYFYEKKKGMKDFCTEDFKGFYGNARIPVPSNVSGTVLHLAKDVYKRQRACCAEVPILGKGTVQIYERA